MPRHQSGRLTAVRLEWQGVSDVIFVHQRSLSSSSTCRYSFWSFENRKKKGMLENLPFTARVCNCCTTMSSCESCHAKDRSASAASNQHHFQAILAKQHLA
jgi:hypothetical protein